MELSRLRVLDHKVAAFFRYRVVGERVVVTNDVGAFAILDKSEFAAYARGTVEQGTELHERLAATNLIADAVDVAAMQRDRRQRQRFLNVGPNLHIMVITLRCNETCVYCHASRRAMDAVDTDMSTSVAEQTVDLILATTNSNVTIEFQGGEPLANFDVMKHIVDYALSRNKALGKTIEFTLVSNLSLMDEDKLTWLMKNRVQVCTSVDGPAPLHDKQRKLPGQSAFDVTARWIRRINQAYLDEGLDPEVYHVEALLTTTQDTLASWREVVDTYVELGCRALFLRPVDPFGFAGRSAKRLSYPIEKYLEFYRRSVDYMIEQNTRGVQILERFASIFLTKILGGEEPNYLDIRSPCGAGIGQVAYSHDGRVFTCDEGRMLSEEGDDTFLIGHVGENSYRQLMGHETVRAMVIASNLDSQPDCVNCAYRPYCGVCPVVNHKTQGSLFGRMRDSNWCAVHKGIQDYLFSKIADNEPHVMEVFNKWITVRERSHYVHE